jgi:hypothetical protein
MTVMKTIDIYHMLLRALRRARGFSGNLEAVLPTPCRTFQPIQKKHLTAEGKNSAPSSFPFLKEFGLKKNTSFVCVSGNNIIAWILPRIRKDKRRKTVLLKFGPFSVLFVQNRPKFGRTIGQLATLLGSCILNNNAFFFKRKKFS